MDFQPIFQLKLKEAFSDNSNFQKIKNNNDYLIKLLNVIIVANYSHMTMLILVIQSIFMIRRDLDQIEFLLY